jgi:hypothetical protein
VVGAEEQLLLNHQLQMVVLVAVELDGIVHQELLADLELRVKVVMAEMELLLVAVRLMMLMDLVAEVVPLVMVVMVTTMLAVMALTD